MATTLPYPAILEMVAAMPEGARMQLLVDTIQCPKGSPIDWSDFAIDALSELDAAIDAKWSRINSVIEQNPPCYASGRDGMTDPYFGGRSVAA